MGIKKENDIDPGKLSVYEKLIAANSKIERKGDTIPYTSLNGHMFSFLGKDGSLGFRLSSDDREKFLRKYPSALLIQHGIVMKEYVKIPDELFNNIKELKKYFELSYEHVKSLKPRPVTKTKRIKKK